MLQNIKHFYGKPLGALDGEIGKVKDFYFDDQSWAIRYVVADTSTWLEERERLLSPHAFGRLDSDAKIMEVNLTRKQIEASPSVQTHLPVSRQHEEEYNRYYGWPNYWEGGQVWGVGSYPMGIASSLRNPADHTHHAHKDFHLRSMHALLGYEIETTDGTKGRLVSFLVGEKNWVVSELVIEVGLWFVGKEIFIATDKVQRISYDEAKIFVTLSKAEIEHTASHELVEISTL